MIAARRALLAPAAIVAALALAAGCGSDRIDPPGGSDETLSEDAPAVDSLAAWAKRAREGWASADSAQAAPAGALARATFAGVWADLAGGRADAGDARDAERLPVRKDAGAPTPDAVREALAGIGLSADIVVADGPLAVWQVVVRDPTGASDAATEFWAWADPEAPLGEPVLQPLPAGVPARARFGPDAVGAIVTYTRPDGIGLASAWTRPRGGSGLEVALAQRSTASGRSANWRVATKNLLPIVADSVAFVTMAPGDPAPSLLVRGAGARDALFDECPTCPHLVRHQRYAFDGGAWTLREEKSAPTPYAAIVAFMHALRDGGLDAARAYATGPEVLEQARELGLERGPAGRLRAAPGTDALDRTQRYRRGGTGGSDALEITVEEQGDRYVVGDLRPTRVVIE